MVLEWVVRNFSHGGSSATTRFFIDMPAKTKNICMIKRVNFFSVEDRLASYDYRWFLSIDPDDDGSDLPITPDSRKFVTGGRLLGQFSAVGVFWRVTDWTWEFPEGIPCPYSRLPFFIAHSNADVTVSNYNVKVFFEFVKVTPQELAVAVMRRGRGVGRRVP